MLSFSWLGYAFGCIQIRTETRFVKDYLSSEVKGSGAGASITKGLTKALKSLNPVNPVFASPGLSECDRRDPKP